MIRGVATPDEGWWTWRRSTAVKGIALAVVTFPFAVFLLYRFWPVDYSQLDRLGLLFLALQWLPLVALFCFFMFTRTARLFDTPGAEEVLAGLESERWKLDDKIYRNTIEMAVFFVPLLLALSTVVTPHEAKILPVLVVLWLFGRLCFWASYHVDPAYRAFGFDYTLFPGLLAGFWFVLRLSTGA